MAATLARNSPNFGVRLAVICAVLLMSGLLPLASARLSQVAIIILMGTVIFLRWPPAGLAALILACLLVPYAIGTSTNSNINAALVLLAGLTVLWILSMVVRRKGTFVLSQPVLPLLALVTATTLSFVAGQLPWFTSAAAPMRAQLGGLGVFYLSAAAFLLMANQVRVSAWLECLTWLFFGLGSVYMAGRVLGSEGWVVTRFFQHGAQGSVVWVWIVAISASQALFNRRLAMRYRLITGCIGLAALEVGFFEGRSWVSGWAPPLAALLGVFWAGAPRVAALATVAGVVGIAAQFSRISEMILSVDQFSFVTRLEALRVLAQMSQVSPVLGLGPANYYFYTPLYGILGYAVQFNSHNNYVDLVAQTGLVGLACFLWFAGSCGILAWRLRMQVPEGFPRAYLIGAFGGLVGMLAAGALGDWVLPFVYNIGLEGMRASLLGWLFLGGIVVLQQSECTSEQGTDESPPPLSVVGTLR